MYQAGRIIQSGSFSTVYYGKDMQTGEEVALKVVKKPQDREELCKVSAMVKNEYTILRKLGKHENICTLKDYYEDENSFVLVLEYCANGDLYDFIKSISTGSTVQIHFHSLVYQICNGIWYCHKMGVSHRDIKPENVLINSQGQVKLTDFGLSQIGVVSRDYCIGTEKYLAPETFSRQLHNTFSADYWSLGITILCTLFGSCPFENAIATAGSNFGRFLEGPLQFIDAYYLNSIKGMVDSSCRSPRKKRERSLGHWLHLPQGRNSCLCSIAHLVVNYLLNIKPERRSMYSFWNKLDYLLTMNGDEDMTLMNQLSLQDVGDEGSTDVPSSPTSHERANYSYTRNNISTAHSGSIELNLSALPSPSLGDIPMLSKWLDEAHAELMAGNYFTDQPLSAGTTLNEELFDDSNLRRPDYVHYVRKPDNASIGII